MALILASTTDSEATMASALGRPSGEVAPAAPAAAAPATPAEPVAAAEPSGEPAADAAVAGAAPASEVAPPAAAAPASTPAPVTAQPEDRGTKRNRAQDRIDELTRDNYTLRRHIDSSASETKSLRDELAEIRNLLRSGTGAQTPAGTPKSEGAAPAEADVAEKPKPVQSDFPDYDDFVEALTDWKTEKAVKRAVEASKETVTKVEQERRQAEVEDAIFRQYDQKLNDARGRYEDFDQVLQAGASLPVSPPMREAILTSDLAGDVMYFLNRRADICQRLANMPATQAVREIGRIEQAILSTSTRRQPADAPAGEPAARPAATAGAARPATTPPSSAVRGSVTAGVPKPLSKIATLKDWEDARGGERTN